MKRNCNGCRALDASGGGTCDLGYRLGVKVFFSHIPVEWKPLEECPKPKTYDQYFNAEKKDQP